MYITRDVDITGMADGGELSAEHLELRLIQSKQDIENSPSLHTVCRSTCNSIGCISIVFILLIIYLLNILY